MRHFIVFPKNTVVSVEEESYITELIKDINRTSYLINDHVKGLDENEMGKAFKELINELESVDYSKLVEHIK